MVEAERVLIAAKDGDLQTLRSLCRSAPFAADGFGATTLHYAARTGRMDCVKWLIETVGISPKVRGKSGATPLHDAAAQGQLECVKYFLGHSAVDVEMRDLSGHTALHLAARFGRFETVKWLIERGNSDTRAKSKNHMTPVHFAASGGHLTCLELLVFKAGYSSVNDVATDGTTPLYLATQDGNLDCLKYLYSVGGKCDARARDGMLPIHGAAQNGHLDCVGYLIEKGQADVDERDTTGATPAHFAAAQGHVSVLKWLNAKGDISSTDNLGGSPLHDAAEQGQFERTRTCNPVEQTNAGCTTSLTNQKTTDQLKKELTEAVRVNKYLESQLNMAKDHIQSLKASSLEELVAQFQLRLFRHYNNGGAPLYDPNEMEAFEPALFTQIINSIFNTGMSKDRQETQRKRTVAIMHILAYFRSQKTAQFQKQSGLNAQLSGMSLTGLAAGPVVGFSVNPRTVLKFKNELALKHTNYVCEQVKKALELNCFIILMIDDYHNVHAKKVPTKLITSTAVHMASCLLDIHPTIPAVPHPQQTPVHRPTFQTEVDVRCFPLSYNLDKVQCGLEPDTSCFCDSPVCHNSSSQQIHVLACFHSFHLMCLSTDGTCIICEPPLKRLAKQLSENFNKGLMKENEDETEEVTVSDDDNSRDLELPSGEETEEYYNSQAWQRKVNDTIGTYSNIHHPTKANHSQLLQPTTCTQRSSPQTSHLTLFSTPALHVLPLQTGNVTTWHFPLSYSQSTLYGRTGSNACTFIALVLSKLHLTAPELPRPHHPLSVTWVFRMVQGMDIGNKFYDSYAGRNPVMFGVREAAQKVQGSLGIASMGPELPADIIRQPMATANLTHHIQLASMMTQTSSVFIIDQKTVAFIPMGQHVLLLDSHCHTPNGAYIAMAPSSRIWELMEWYKAFNCFPYSMGTVTNITFK